MRTSVCRNTAGAGATPRPGRGGAPALRKTSGSGHAAGRSSRQLSRAGGALKSKVRHAGEGLHAGGLSPPDGLRRRGVAMVPRDKQRRAVKSRLGIINRRNRDGGRKLGKPLRSHPVRVCAIVDGHRNTGRRYQRCVTNYCNQHETTLTDSLRFHLRCTLCVPRRRGEGDDANLQASVHTVRLELLHGKDVGRYRNLTGITHSPTRCLPGTGRSM